MPLVEFKLASVDEFDDLDLRHLLRANPLPGEIHLSYEREPSFWAAAGIEGAFHQTMIVRTENGRAVGMGSRSVRTLYLNGEPTSVGYMSQMRVDPTFAWGAALPKLLAQGWRFFRQLHEDGRTPYYLVSLVANESVAWRMMTMGLPEWPTLLEVGGLLTYGIYVRRARHLPALTRGMTLRCASLEDREAIAECLARNGRRRQFTPQWEATTLGDPMLTPDLHFQDFWLVEQGTQVVGTLARWNQRRVKQSVVRGYGNQLGRKRPYINLVARFGLAPRLPNVGEQVCHAFASHLAVDNDNPQVAAALLAAVYNRAVEAGDDYLMLGLDIDHPFATVVRGYRRVVYATQLFLATWGEQVALAQALDERQIGAEIAVL